MRAKRKGRARATMGISGDAKKRAEALPEIMIEEAAADALRNYLARGRRFEHIETNPLRDRWTAEARQFLQSRGQQNQRGMQDAEAELGLRQITLPYETIQAEFRCGSGRDFARHRRSRI